MTRLVLCLLGALGVAACGGAHPLAGVSHSPLPDWTDKYSDTNVGDWRFFNIGALMEGYGLSRLQAVELQNHYRDRSRAQPEGDPEVHFAEALAAVKAGEHESGLDEEALAKADFIVVFDLDETIYDQYLKEGEGCHDLAVPEPGKDEPRYIKLVPGWDQVIRKVRDLGGLVVLFSANLDELTLRNLSHMELAGQKITPGHPDIAGILTNSYLVQQSKHEGPGKEKPRRGRPVPEPSKDLRLFDADLSRVIIVDDNPTRLFQMRNARVLKKFDGNLHCSAKEPAEKAMLEQLLPTVAREIEESVAYARTHEVPFAQAYLPYSQLGRLAVEALVLANGWTHDQGIAHVRKHPSLVDKKF